MRGILLFILGWFVGRRSQPYKRSHRACAVCGDDEETERVGDKYYCADHYYTAGGK